MSAPSIFPLTPVSKTKFATAEARDLGEVEVALCTFDVFNPETDDSEMGRVRDLIVARLGDGDALATAARTAASALDKIPAFGETIGFEVSKAELGVALRALRSALEAFK